MHLTIHFVLFFLQDCFLDCVVMGGNHFLNIILSFLKKVQVLLNLGEGKLCEITSLLEFDPQVALEHFAIICEYFLSITLGDGEKLVDVLDVLLCSDVGLGQVINVQFQIDVVTPVWLLDLHFKPEEEVLLTLFFFFILLFKNVFFHLINHLLGIFRHLSFLFTFLFICI